MIPDASGGLPVYVGGITAIFDDFAGVLTDKLPLFIAVIVLLGCLLLMIAFRSILIPLTAAVMNLLAAGAAFGVVTLVFQDGFLAGPLGVGTGPVEAFLPVMMLAILFGLSMDYQVFLVSRMHEEWVNTARQPPLGPDRAGRDRPGDHRRGDDHDLRLRLVPARRAARDRRVRRRPRQRRVPGRVHPAHRPRPRGRCTCSATATGGCRAAWTGCCRGSRSKAPRAESRAAVGGTQLDATAPAPPTGSRRCRPGRPGRSRRAGRKASGTPRPAR